MRRCVAVTGALQSPRWVAHGVASRADALALAEQRGGANRSSSGGAVTKATTHLVVCGAAPGAVATKSAKAKKAAALGVEVLDEDAFLNALFGRASLDEN